MTEICLHREFDHFFCPVTGKNVLHPEGYNTPPSLLFIYIEEIQGYEYIHPELQKKFPVAFTEYGQTINGEAHFKKLKKEEEWAEDKLLVSFGSIGTVSLCFDLGYEVTPEIHESPLAIVKSRKP
ncbi:MULTISPECIES: hypothetical protein [Bacteria]|uniref:hypothetical protein n=1 Tax=Bacteria TaxID=2 RepID=UPI0036445741